MNSVKVHRSTDEPDVTGAQWPTIKVGKALNLINGRAFKPTEWAKTGVPIVRIQNLNNPEAPFNYYQGDLPTKIALNNGDLLFAWSGTPGTSFGAHIWRGGKAWLNQHIFKVEFDELQFDKRFLQLAINQNLVEYIRAAHGGAGLAHITKGRFEASDIPLPSIPEQRRIVAEIEKQFTRLDAGVTALRRVQANLKRYRAVVLKAAFEGRLVPTESDLIKAGIRNSKLETGEAQIAGIVAERRKNWQGRGPYKEPAALDTSSLVTLPDGWIWTSIGTCFFVAVGATPSRREASYWGGEIPWVSSGEVHFSSIFNTRETITQTGVENSSTQMNPSGSVLLGMIGEGKTRGQTAILKIDACNNQNCAAIWVSRTPVPPEYVYYWLWSQYDNTRRSSSGNNQPALNKARIEAMLLPFPPLAEQQRIVAEVERRLSVVEELETLVIFNLARAARLRQSILQRAFLGELNQSTRAES